MSDASVLQLPPGTQSGGGAAPGGRHPGPGGETPPRGRLQRGPGLPPQGAQKHRVAWYFPHPFPPLTTGPPRSPRRRHSPTFQAALHDVGHGAVGLHGLPDQQDPISIHLPDVWARGGRGALCGAHSQGSEVEFRGGPSSSEPLSRPCIPLSGPEPSLPWPHRFWGPVPLLPGRGPAPLLQEAREEPACLTTGLLHRVYVQEPMERPSLAGPCPPPALVRDASVWLSSRAGRLIPSRDQWGLRARPACPIGNSWRR